MNVVRLSRNKILIYQIVFELSATFSVISIFRMGVGLCRDPRRSQRLQYNVSELFSGTSQRQWRLCSIYSPGSMQFARCPTLSSDVQCRVRPL